MNAKPLFWKGFEKFFNGDYSFIKWAFNSHGDPDKAVKFWNQVHGHRYQIQATGYIELDLPKMYEIYLKTNLLYKPQQEKINENLQSK